jgi:hypothetical protein
MKKSITKEISDRFFYLYKLTNVKKDGSFDGFSEDMIAIAKFNETMSQILNTDSKIENKSENINLMRYSSFGI